MSLFDIAPSTAPHHHPHYPSPDPLFHSPASSLAHPPLSPSHDPLAFFHQPQHAQPSSPYQQHPSTHSASSFASPSSVASSLFLNHPSVSPTIISPHAHNPSFSNPTPSFSPAATSLSVHSSHVPFPQPAVASLPLADPLSFLAAQHQQQQQHVDRSVNTSPDFSSISSSATTSPSSSVRQSSARGSRRSRRPSTSVPAPPAPAARAVPPPLQSIASLSRGSYGSFSAPACHPLITKLLMPVLFVLCLSVLIVYSVADRQCAADTSNGSPSPADAASPSHGWCCQTSFTRYLSISSFALHTFMLAWLLQLYHTPFFSFFPTNRRGCIMLSFFLRASFLIIVWMLYFLILSLNLISTIPEQVSCSLTSSDRSLFYPADVLGLLSCVFVGTFLGFMGKKIWKYWELRHLTPSELLEYETQLEEGRHFGLSETQISVLTKVLLTCTHGSTNMEDCPVCGYSQYKPPSLTTAISTSIAPRFSAVTSILRSNNSSRRAEQADTEQVELPDLRQASASPPPTSLPSSPSLDATPLSLDSSDASTSSLLSSSSASSSTSMKHLAPPASDGVKSTASLVPHGGLPSMTCGICLEDYMVHNRVMILPCRHHSHVECLTGWLSGHRTCPMCRQMIVKQHR